eukprot:scaffold3731_cov381-Prasinococcus_capsulatus_cf.AAC.5
MGASHSSGGGATTQRAQHHPYSAASSSQPTRYQPSYAHNAPAYGRGEPSSNGTEVSGCGVAAERLVRLRDSLLEQGPSSTDIRQGGFHQHPSPLGNYAPPQYRPQGQMPVALPRTVMCSRCGVLLSVPLGAPRFHCYNCRALLSLDLYYQSGQFKPSQPVRAQGAPGLQWTKTHDNQRWVRRVGDDGRLRWARVLTAEEQDVLKAAENDLSAIALDVDTIMDNLMQLPPKELKYRLERLGLASKSKGAIEKSDLAQALAGAGQVLREMSNKQLKEILESIGVDSRDCLEKDEMIRRLTVIAFKGLGEKGWVRQLGSNGQLDWVEAGEYAMDPVLPIPSINLHDLHKAASYPFEQKVNFFHTQLATLRVPWEHGHVPIKVHRQNLLEDSFALFRRLKPEDLRRIFRFNFIGEPAQDAGGVAREWFLLISEELFNLDFGLFEYGAADNLCYTINPASGIANDHHLEYFNFAGRFLGKCLFDRQHCAAHVTFTLIKHLLGWPIMLRDLEQVDLQLWNSLQELMESDDPEALCLDFTVTLNKFGEICVEELKRGGEDVTVTKENREEYAELLLRHLLFERVRKQLVALLQGFYQVIPPPLLSIFDPNEFELLLCGLPNIDVKDWMKYTRYRGSFEAKGPRNQVIKWFWEVVERDFTQVCVMDPQPHFGPGLESEMRSPHFRSNVRVCCNSQRVLRAFLFKGLR